MAPTVATSTTALWPPTSMNNAVARIRSLTGAARALFLPRPLLRLHQSQALALQLRPAPPLMSLPLLRLRLPLPAHLLSLRPRSASLLPPPLALKPHHPAAQFLHHPRHRKPHQ